MIEVVLSKIVIRETSDHQRIVLREKGGQRQFPIVIGIYEALAIDRRVRDRPSQRPMTHSLMAGIVTALDATLVRVVISDLRQNTFFARLEFVKRDGGAPIQVDARPSDAIALASHLEAPIFVEEAVLDAVLASPD